MLIPSIGLARGANSGFRLNVDGQAGKQFTDIPLYAQDSLFIFIEATVTEAADTAEFLYTDILQFDTDGNRQNVVLSALVQNAIVLFPDKNEAGMEEQITLEANVLGERRQVPGFTLKHGQLTLTDSLPYIIYGYAAVPENKKLTLMERPTYFHKMTGLVIRKGASIQTEVQNKTDQARTNRPILLEGDRLEQEFADIPGQWEGVFFEPMSAASVLENVIVRNAEVGIGIHQPDNVAAGITLKNCRFSNNKKYNVHSLGGRITMQNCIIGGAGDTSFYALGGSYDLTHCTLSNYWNQGFRLGLRSIWGTKRGPTAKKTRWYCPYPWRSSRIVLSMAVPEQN